MQDLDFGDFDCFRSQLYQKGRLDGIKDAQSKSYSQNLSTGLSYGRQWGKQFALIQLTIDILKQKLSESSTNTLLQAPKVVQLVEQLGEKLRESYPPGENVHKIERDREEARKKYNILLAMLGVKGGEKIESKENMGF